MKMNPARLSLVGLVSAVLMLAACGGNSFSVGGTISGLSGTVVLQNNGTSNLSISANGAFTFPGYLTGGSAYNVTVLTQPTGQTCTVSSGSGKVNSTVTSVVVTCSKTSLARYAYVANSGNNTISQYIIGTGGALTALTALTAATVPAGSAPNSIAVYRSATASYVYVANSGSNDIWQYAIGKDAGKEGELTKMSATSPVAGSEPSSIAINTVTSGTYAYVTNSGSALVSQYPIGSNGELTTSAVKTVSSGTTPRFITIHPSGKYAYVANSGSDDISQYSIGDDGALTSMPSISLPPGSAPASIAIATAPTGTYYAYVANSGGTSIAQYTIESGGLKAMSQPTVDAGATPYSVTVEPLGKYAYVANSNNGGSVSQYTIEANGSLKAMTTATVSAGTSPRSVTVDPSGQYVYTANHGGDNISQYTIGTGTTSTGGALTPIAAAVAAGSKPVFVITVK